MKIIGAGVSGLLCGALNPGSTIYEAGPERDTGQKAVFRLRSERICDLLGIEFKKVKVHKAIWFDDRECAPSIQLAHMYSHKVTGKITCRSIFDIDSVERFIPPVDFIDQLAERCDIIWDYSIDGLSDTSVPIVSTAPICVNAKLCGLAMQSVSSGGDIVINRIPLEDCDSYCTMYYPSPEINTYRASITGDVLIIESIGGLTDRELNKICWSFGIPFKRSMLNHVKNKIQKNGKISSMDNKEREKIISDMTLNHNLYSLGRFATWRPKVMLDDVLDDICHIRRLIKCGVYHAIKHKQSEVK